MPWPAVLAVAGLIGVAGRARRRAVDAAALRHLFRDLHLRALGTDPPGRHLVRDQRSPLGRPLHLSQRSPPSRSTGSSSRSLRSCFARRLPGRPLAPRPCAARHRQRRDRGAPRRHRHDARQARDVRRQRAVHDADRRRDGAALDLHRSGDRVLADAVVRGGHHGAARRRRPRCSGRCSAPCRWCCCSRC